METSLFLAKLIGPLLFIVGTGFIVNPDHYSRMTKSFFNNAELYYFSGTTAFIIGLTIIYFHNLWVNDWRVVITLMGWISLAKGMYRIIFPTIGASFADAILPSRYALYALGALFLVLGAWLTSKGG